MSAARRKETSEVTGDEEVTRNGYLGVGIAQTPCLSAGTSTVFTRRQQLGQSGGQSAGQSAAQSIGWSVVQPPAVGREECVCGGVLIVLHCTLIVVNRPRSIAVEVLKDTSLLRLKRK